MEFGELGQKVGRLNKQLDRIIDINTGCCDPNVTSSGVNSSVPAGLKGVSIIKTSSGGTVNITLSDSSIYPLILQGEGFSQSGKKLPAYPVATSDGATWKWVAIK